MNSFPKFGTDRIRDLTGQELTNPLAPYQYLSTSQVQSVFSSYFERVKGIRMGSCRSNTSELAVYLRIRNVSSTKNGFDFVDRLDPYRVMMYFSCNCC